MNPTRSSKQINKKERENGIITCQKKKPKNPQFRSLEILLSTCEKKK